ncbi:MAG: hypothetical protein IPH27_05185 [Actinomycetales bacterium]|nr:hypothetical protein [Candidatus Phosphoribacter baldrii]
MVHALTVGGRAAYPLVCRPLASAAAAQHCQDRVCRSASAGASTPDRQIPSM